MKFAVIMILIFFGFSMAYGLDELPSVEDLNFDQQTINAPGLKPPGYQDPNSQKPTEDICKKLRKQKAEFEEDEDNLAKNYEEACASDHEKCAALEDTKEKLEAEYPKIMQALKDNGCAYNERSKAPVKGE